MVQGIFSNRKNPADSPAGRRRSTRITYQTDVILSGRDAAGQVYRDETITEIVNIHGARIRTDRKILVGMLVSIEVPKTGQGTKAVCVNVYEPTPEEPDLAIAVQILKPGNIWGVEEPPSDWATVAVALGAPASPAESSWSGVASQQAPRVAPRVAPPVADSAQAARMQRVLDDALNRFRGQLEALSRSALAEFDARLGDRFAAADVRVSRKLEEASSEYADAIQTLKGNLVSELVQATLDEARVRLDEMVKEFETQTTRRIA